MLDHLRTINEGHLSERYDNNNLSARVASYELAYKMQVSALEAVMWTVNLNMSKTSTAWMVHRRFWPKCLLCRLVERGVRFIQIYSVVITMTTTGMSWRLVKNHSYHAGNTDKPIAGLLKT